MTDPKRIADELLVLAAATSDLGMTDAALQISVAAGLVLADHEAAVWSAGGRTETTADGLGYAVEHGNIVVFRRPAR